MLPSASALASRRKERVQKAFFVDHHGPGDARLSHSAAGIYGEYSNYVPAISPIVQAQSAQVGIGERKSRRYWGQQLVVRGQLHSPMGKLVMRAAHVAPIRAWCFNSKRTSFHVVLELEHVKSVDLRSAIRKADAVLPVFARAGQRSDTLKRVARRCRCTVVSTRGATNPSTDLACGPKAFPFLDRSTGGVGARVAFGLSPPCTSEENKRPSESGWDDGRPADGRNV